MSETAVKPVAEWLLQIQQNDEQALALLMDEYYNDLYNYGSRLTKDHELIKDCIQEVFISLWQRRATAAAILSPKYYFLRATKNKILKAIHKGLQQSPFENSSDEYISSYEFSIEEMIIEKQISQERTEKFRNTLLQLSDKQKEIVYLKYYQHLDHGQIAELMNISRQSVYNLLYKTLHKLRLILRQSDLINQ
jgi:RNA polymerase sigma factor (sigma-70 family)